MSYSVRRGGHEGPEGWVFELSGGNLALDFVNTVDHRPDPERRRELLRSYADLIGFAVQSGILERGRERKLLRAAKGSPGRAEKVVERARRIREVLHELFAAKAEGRSLPRGALEALNRELGGAYPPPVLATDGERVVLDWPVDTEALDAMLAPVLRAGVDLLRSEELSRVRVCAADACGWLFLDQSKNRSRQWCDMTVCGNRAKARRHYERTRRQKQSANLKRKNE